MRTRSIAGLQVGEISLGGMHMSLATRPSAEQSIRTIHAALDAGVTLLDTADAYCADSHDVGHNEELFARALREWSGDQDSILVATKGGHIRTESGAWDVDGRPEHIRAACDASLKALGVESIGLYQFHRPDPKVPYAESLGVLVELLELGKIRLAGISNANVSQIDLAASMFSLVSVQNEFSPRFRSSAGELDHCAEIDVAFLAWSPLGGMGDAAELGQQHPAFAEVASARGVSPQQVALAWELALAPVMIPIVGSTRPESILDSIAAADLVLTSEEMDLLQG